MFNKYYQDELSYLRELGQEFARAYPEAAHFVGEPGSDPDVERLLEGFAFLTARIRQKLDDEIPELTHDLVEMFWPHYLRPTPSMAMLQFAPLPQAVREVRVIPRGTEVLSAPVDGTPCRFRTAYDVTLLPLFLENASLKTDAPPALKLRIRLPDGLSARKLTVSFLRLHLAGDAVVTRSLYLCLRRYLRRVLVQPATGGAAPVPMPRAEVRPVGYGPEEALLASQGGAFPGFRLLQEYFSFPSKFMFLDVAGLEELGRAGDTSAFDLIFEFDRLPDAMPAVSVSNVMLSCTPAVNLFSHDADPIRLDPARTEYKIRPAGENPEHFEIYSVDKVVGLVRGTGKPQEYRPLLRFARPADEEVLFYRHRVVPALAGEGTDVFILPLPPEVPGALADVETLSLDLTCTNRQMPGRLNLSDIAQVTGEPATFARLRNVTRPTPSLAAPLGGDLHWRLLSHLTLNYLSLIDLDALRGVLGLYNFRARVDRQAEQTQRLMLDGILRVASRPSTRLFRGAPVRGLDVQVDVQEENFGGEGEAYLFGCLLDEFLQQYVTMNAFCRLTLKGQKYGEIHEWSTRMGRRIIL